MLRASEVSSILTSRREFLSCLTAAAVCRHRAVAATKPLRGIFIILSTPYIEAKALDYEDLAAEVDIMDRCGVHGISKLRLGFDSLTVLRTSFRCNNLGIGEAV